MLKARLILGNGEPLVFLGLTRENVAALQEGRPILLDLSEVGLGAGKAVISYGLNVRVLMGQVRELAPGSNLPEVDDPDPGEAFRFRPGP